MKNSNVPILNDLTDADVESLKTEYLDKNIINLYEVANVYLYSVNRNGVTLLDLSLTEEGKIFGGYEIDKNCAVTKISDYVYEIVKVLDPKLPTGFGISATVKRI